MFCLKCSLYLWCLPAWINTIIAVSEQLGHQPHHFPRLITLPDRAVSPLPWVRKEMVVAYGTHHLARRPLGGIHCECHRPGFPPFPAQLSQICRSPLHGSASENRLSRGPPYAESLVLVG
jgi:hypothetical protein